MSYHIMKLHMQKATKNEDKIPFAFVQMNSRTLRKDCKSMLQKQLKQHEDSAFIYDHSVT